MNAVEFLKIKKRLCSNQCTDCPFSHYNNSDSSSCGCVLSGNPEKAVELVEKWAKAHPLKTYKDDFLEKFPKTKITSSGTPSVCRDFIYGGGCGRVASGDCESCWNDPMEVISNG